MEAKEKTEQNSWDWVTADIRDVLQEMSWEAYQLEGYGSKGYKYPMDEVQGLARYHLARCIMDDLIRVAHKLKELTDMTGRDIISDKGLWDKMVEDYNERNRKTLEAFNK